MAVVQPSQQQPVFDAVSVGKRFPGINALQDVSLKGYPGEVIAVCGANGAGKSTFARLLAGLMPPSQGEILFGGAPLKHHAPRDGLDAGVLMMHQEPLIIDDLSVAENLWLFDLNRPWHAATRRHAPAESRTLLDRVGLHDADLAQRAGDLTPGSRHMLALARVFIVPHRLLILDETTASTNEEHFEIVVDIVRQRRAAGSCVIFVSHKLNEVQVVADRIAVLRDGCLVDVTPARGHSEEDISAMMIGERLSALSPKPAPASIEAAPALRLEGFSCGRLKHVDLEIRPGEVVGLYGLVGSGRSTLGRGLGGHFGFSANRLDVDGRAARIGSPRDAIAAGVCYITEDRHKEGFVPHFSNQFNMSLVALTTLAQGGMIDRGQEARLGAGLIERFGVRGGLDDLTTNLSGGNQQKICVAKWVPAAAKVIIVDEPTKGVDVGAKRQIYAIIEQFAREGKAVLLISSEAEEVMHLADRTLVMVEYEVAAELRAGAYDKTRLISIALGGELRARRAAARSH